MRTRRVGQLVWPVWLVLLVAVGASANVDNFECPPNGPAYQVYPVPNQQCSPQYYICVNHSAVHKTCPAGQLFDTTTNHCENRIEGCNFECTTRRTGMYGVGCSDVFWWCWSGQATRHTCVKGLYFDEVNGECTYKPWVAACGGERPLTTSPASDTVETTTIDFDCSSRPDGDYSYIEGVCNNYFASCTNGRAYRRNCPSNLKFSPDSGFCDYPENIFICGGKPIHTIGTTHVPSSTVTPDTIRHGSDVAHGGLCANKQHGRFALGVCASDYIDCRDGREVHVTCPSGMVFDEVLGCDRPAWVPACVGMNARTPNAPRTTLSPREHHDFGSTWPRGPMVTSVPRAADTTVASIATCMEGAVRESGECREEYLRCVHGSYVRQWCLKGVEAFYAPLSTCLPVAAIPACSHTTKAMPSSSTTIASHDLPSSAPVCTPLKCRSNEQLALGDCLPSFIQCILGVAVEQPCHKGEAFDSVTMKCRDRAHIDACAALAAHIVVESDSHASTTPPMCAADERIVKDICSAEFLLCSNGKLVDSSCAANEVFDAGQHACAPISSVLGCTATLINEGHMAPGQLLPVQPNVPTMSAPRPQPAADNIIRPTIQPQPSQFPTGSQFVPPPQQAAPSPSSSSGYRQTNDVPTCVERQTGYVDECSLEYFVCIGGDWVAQSCSFGQVFDYANSGRCVAVVLVPACLSQRNPPVRQPSSSYSAAQQSPSSYTGCAEGAAFAVGVCSNEYVVCSQSTWRRQRCTGNTVFSSLASTCLPSSQVPNCVADSADVIMPSTGSYYPSADAAIYYPTSSVAPPTCSIGAMYALGACSEEFVVCVHGGDWLRKYCPAATVFAQSAGSCVPPLQVPGCLPQAPANYPVSPVSPRACTDGQRTAIGECVDQFYECQSNGRAVLKACPRRTVFDPRTLSCQRRDDVNECEHNDGRRHDFGRRYDEKFLYDDHYRYHDDPFARPWGAQWRMPHVSRHDNGFMSDLPVIGDNLCKLKKNKDGNYELRKCSASYARCEGGVAKRKFCELPWLGFSERYNRCLLRRRCSVDKLDSNDDPLQYVSDTLDCRNRTDGLHAVRCSPYYAQCEDRKRVKTHYCPLPWQTYSEARKRCHRDWLCSAADYPYFNEHADLESQKGMNTAEQIVDFLFAPFLGRRESADMSVKPHLRDSRLTERTHPRRYDTNAPMDYNPIFESQGTDKFQYQRYGKYAPHYDKQCDTARLCAGQPKDKIVAGKCSPKYYKCGGAVRNGGQTAIELTCARSYVYSYDYNDCVPYSWIPGCVAYTEQDTQADYYDLKWPGGLVAHNGRGDYGFGDDNMIGSDFHERDAFGYPTIERHTFDAKFPGYDAPRNRAGAPPRVRNDSRQKVRAGDQRISRLDDRDMTRSNRRPF